MLFTPRHMPCTECGSSVDIQDDDAHLCLPDEVVEYTLFSLQGSTLAFSDDLGRWLLTPLGAFETWCAARTVRLRR